MRLTSADMNQLKAANDRGGRPAAAHVAGTLRAQLRPHDLIIRFGVHKFLCGVAGLGPDDMARRLRDANTVLANQAAPGSFTVGLAQLQPDDTSADLIERADPAVQAQRACGLTPRRRDLATSARTVCEAHTLNRFRRGTSRRTRGDLGFPSAGTPRGT